MMSAKILHIADLHISEGNSAEVAVLLEKMSTNIRDSGIIPDCICICGDISNSGQVSEFLIAEKLFNERLLEPLGLSPEDVILCPGNHDVNRDECIQPLEGSWTKRFQSNEAVIDYMKDDSSRKEMDIMKGKLQNFHDFSDRFLSAASDFFCNTKIVECNDLKIGFVVINTAWLSSGFGPDEGRLVIYLDEIIEATRMLKEQGAQCLVAVGHHSDSMFTPWNRRDSRNLCATHFDLFLCGHFHQRDTESVKRHAGICTYNTCNSIWEGRHKSGYSTIQINDVLMIESRRWNSKALVFEADDEFGDNGVYCDSGFLLKDKNAQRAISILKVKQELGASGLDKDVIVRPFDEIEDVALRDVFVEPLLTDDASGKSRGNKVKEFDINQIISQKTNYIIYGRKEYGKTTLLRYIYERLIDSDELSIPVLINFDELPKNNVNSVARLAVQKCAGAVRKEEMDEYLKSGTIIFLVDDINNPRSLDLMKKKRILADFVKLYPDCRFIGAAQQGVATESNELIASEQFSANCCYLSSFNTARIRSLLEKWCKYSEFDVDDTLKAVMRFFKQLHLPATPLAAILFVSVLIKQRKSKHIYNEAYLVENYIEASLEKLADRPGEAEMDFRDKESFLERLALYMFENDGFYITINEYEKLKIEFFDYYDEDVPSQSEFDIIFKKGILKKMGGEVGFGFKFLYFFFLAKSLQNNPECINEIFNSGRVVMFSSALTYKAGLDRTDPDLLQRVGRLLNEKMKIYEDSYSHRSFEDTGLESELMEFSKDTKLELESRNKDENHNELSDRKYLDYDENDQEISREESYNEISELLTLHGDMLRNAKIKSDLKRSELKKHISNYKLLIIGVVEQFKVCVERMENEELEKALGFESEGVDDGKVVKKVLKLIVEIIPVSVILYIAEHLSSPKIPRPLEAIIDKEQSPEFAILCILILYVIDPQKGEKKLREWLKKNRSQVLEGMAWSCILFDGHSRKLSDHGISRVANLLDELRQRVKSNQKKNPPFVKDRFVSDVKHELAKVSRK